MTTTTNPQPVEVAGFTLLRSREEWEAWRQCVQKAYACSIRDKEAPGEYPTFIALDGYHYTTCLYPADITAMHTAFGSDDAKRAEAAEARVERLRRALWAEQKAYNALYNHHNELWGDTIPPEFDCAEMPADWDDGTEEARP